MVFAPTDLSPLFGYEFESGSIWADTARTTPATNGGNVRGVTDLSGNGLHLARASGSVPTWQAPVNGDMGALIFPTSRDALLANTAFASNGFTTFHICALFENNTSLNGAFLIMGTEASYGIQSAMLTSEPITTFNTGTAQGYSTTAGCEPIQDITFDGAGVGDAARFKTYINGCALTLTYNASIPASLVAAAGLQLGRSSLGFTGGLRAVWAFPAPLSAENRFNMTTYLQRRDAQGTRKYVICAGDSLTAGSVAKQPNSYPAQLATALGSGWHVNNNGWFGSLLQASWLAGGGLLAAQVWPPAGHPVDAEVWLLGTNDLNNARTDVQVEANLTTLWALRRAAGKTVVACTIPPSTALTGSEETYRLAVNVFIAASGPGGTGLVDAVVDFAASPMNDPTNATYYSDGTHPTAVGYGVWAPLVQTALGTLTVKGTDTSPSGPRQPASVNLDSSAGTVAWTNAINAIQSENVYATVALVAQTSQLLKTSNHGFNIPSTWTINGIAVTVEGKSLTGTQTFTGTLLKAGVAAGNPETDTLPTSEVSSPLGGATDLWGTTWTPAQINAWNFGLQIQMASAITDTVSIDVAAQITVYASAPAAGAGNLLLLGVG